MTYLNWDTKIITDFSSDNIEALYDNGYVFTRVDRGVMNRTRSCRIDLSRFSPSSENRRIANKVRDIKLVSSPIPYTHYRWDIGKLAMNFYEKRDADFSANKIKELLTDGAKSNFNTLLIFSSSEKQLGYVICLDTKNITHYSYPFYLEDATNPSLGLGMMIIAIERAISLGKKYIYLGSLQRPSDTYKLQFAGLEWFDGTTWQTDTTPLKSILK